MRRFLVVVLAGVVAAGMFAAFAAGAFAAGASARACSSSDLGVWVAVGQGSAAAGSVFYPLEFTNVGRRACSLDGYPGVSALARSGSQLGSPAGRYPDGTPRPVVIAAGATAHAEFVYSDAAVATSPGCDPTYGAQLLRVYPPGQRTATYALFSLEVCARPGATYMSVGPVLPGPDGSS